MTDVETPAAAAPSKRMEEISRDGIDDGEDEATKVKKEKERTLWTRIWQGLAGGSIGLAIAAMAIEASALPIIAGVIAVVVGAVVIKFQFDLQDTDSLRRIQNLLRKDVNRIQEENNKLDHEVDRLTEQVGKLETTEKKLQDITAEQGANVDSLVSLVKENGEILEKMKDVLRAEALQTLMSVVMDSDIDGSFTITGAEVEILVMRLQNVEGVKFHEESFREKVGATDGSVGTIVELVKDMYDEDIPEEEQIFEVDLEQVSSTRVLQQ